MSDSSFIIKAIGTELEAITKSLSLFMKQENAEPPQTLTEEDIDREAALIKDEETAAKIVGAGNEGYNEIVSYMSSREIEDRTRRDIIIARADRKQIMLSSVRVLYDRHNKLMQIIEESKQNQE